MAGAPPHKLGEQSRLSRNRAQGLAADNPGLRVRADNGKRQRRAGAMRRRAASTGSMPLEQSHFVIIGQARLGAAVFAGHLLGALKPTAALLMWLAAAGAIPGQQCRIEGR